MVLCSFSPFASRFDVLCNQGFSYAYLGCNEWLFDLMLPLDQLQPVWPFSSDLCHQQGIFAHRIAAHCFFFLFRTILCKP